MKIQSIDIYTFERTTSRTYELVQVPTVKRTQYTHKARPGSGTAYEHILRVRTDEGVEGLCELQDSVLIGEPSRALELLRVNALGEDPRNREYLFQKFFGGTRWTYQAPGWFGAFDLCLWDIAGRAKDQSVADMIGRVRPAMPIYMTGGDGPLELYTDHIDRGRDLGITAYKPHSYKGGKADLPILEALRSYVGPEYDLMLDPVCSYDLREAIEVATLMDELDYVWLEEPFPEQRMHLYQELCASVSLPILATERLMHDMDLTAQWLIQGATDLLRGNARNGGATQILKLAHFAELHGATIELNGTGGLYGIVHAVLGQCISNTRYYELSVGDWSVRPDERFRNQAAEVGLMNGIRAEDGVMVPPEGPGWGAEWDIAYLEKKGQKLP
jgi:L-alanine-DL-glutamate epimerase-like enolase superfamily enzyme